MAQFQDLVSAYYDAVLKPEDWHAAISRTRHHFQSSFATLSVLDSARQQTHFATTDGLPELVEELKSTVAAKLPYYSVLHKHELEVPYLMEDTYRLYGPGGREAQFAGAFGQWIKKANFRDSINMAITRKGNLHGFLNLMIDQSRSHFSLAELADVTKLAPHIRRAVTISDLFGFKTSIGDLLSTLLDQFNVAILVVDEHMRILHANSRADRALVSATLFESRAGLLMFNSSLAHAAIAQSIAKSMKGEFALAGLGIDVPLSQVSRPAVAHVLPLQTRESRPFARAAAAIFVAEPGEIPMAVVDAVANLFGLTRAECKVVSQVAQGMTRAEIAESGGVKDGTVKAQLKAIFEKTGVSSQRALEKLVTDLSPPILLAGDAKRQDVN